MDFSDRLEQEAADSPLVRREEEEEGEKGGVMFPWLICQLLLLFLFVFSSS